MIERKESLGNYLLDDRPVPRSQSVQPRLALSEVTHDFSFVFSRNHAD